MKGKILCIIPARGGSKRIPKKNIKNFLGMPIISYPIKTALQSKIFSEVMVSTDDEEIAIISKKFGAKVPFLRSVKNSDDYAILNDVIQEVLSDYKKTGKTFQYACCILATSPFIKKENLKKGFKILKSKKNHTVISINRFEYPIDRALRIDEKNELHMINPNNYSIRSQDFENSYHDAGQFYWFYPDLGIKTKIITGLEIPKIQSQDIDNIDDWEIAEFKYKYLQKNKNHCDI